MNNTKVYLLKITDDFENRMENFQKNLPKDEEIISTSMNEDWCAVTVRFSAGTKFRNLLLEEGPHRGSGVKKR